MWMCPPPTLHCIRPFREGAVNMEKKLKAAWGDKWRRREPGQGLCDAPGSTAMALTVQRSFWRGYAAEQLDFYLCLVIRNWDFGTRVKEGAKKLNFLECRLQGESVSQEWQGPSSGTYVTLVDLIGNREPVENFKVEMNELSGVLGRWIWHLPRFIFWCRMDWERRTSFCSGTVEKGSVLLEEEESWIWKTMLKLHLLL